MKNYNANTSFRQNKLVYFTFPYLILILLSIKTFYFRYVTFFFVLVFVTAFILTGNKGIIKKKYLYLFWFFIGYSLLGFINGNPVQVIKNLCMLILNLAPFYIFDWVFSNKRKYSRMQNSKSILKIMTPVLIYTVFITLYYLFKNPYIARYMANYDPSRGIDPNMGINIDLPTAIGGGYVLIYGIILLPPVFIYLAKNNFRKISLRLFYLFTSLFLLYFIIKSGFTTAFIISTVGSFCAIIFLKRYHLINKTLLFTGIIIIAMVLLNEQLLSNVINSIIHLLPEKSIISIRLAEVVPAIYGSSSDTTSFSMRLLESKETIFAFLTNPLLGIGYKVGFDYIGVSKFIGLHTEWLDILSQYGLFLGVPLLMFIGISFKEVILLFKSTSSELIMKIVIMMVIVLGFFNPIMTSATYIIVMVYIPCILMLTTTYYNKGSLKTEEIINESINSDDR